jgi:hypothetical protein
VLASEINAAFLETDDARVSILAPDAVKHFLEKKTWPELDDRAYLNLQCRAWVARDVVAGILNTAMPEMQRRMLERTIPTAFNRFIEWAFIDSWKLAGKAVLAHMWHKVAKQT